MLGTINLLAKLGCLTSRLLSLGQTVTRIRYPETERTVLFLGLLIFSPQRSEQVFVDGEFGVTIFIDSVHCKTTGSFCGQLLGIRTQNATEYEDFQKSKNPQYTPAS